MTQDWVCQRRSRTLGISQRPGTIIQHARGVSLAWRSFHDVNSAEVEGTIQNRRMSHSPCLRCGKMLGSAHTKNTRGATTEPKEESVPAVSHSRAELGLLNVTAHLNIYRFVCCNADLIFCKSVQITAVPGK